MSLHMKEISRRSSEFGWIDVGRLYAAAGRETHKSL